MAKRKTKNPIETIIIAVVLVALALATAVYVFLTFRATIVKNTLNNDADRYFSVLYVDYDDTLLISDCYGEGLVRKTPPTPTREDFDFLGWSMNDSIKVYSTVETYNMTIDKDVIFKAVYQEHKLTVNYLDSDMSLIQSFDYSSSDPMPKIDNPTKEGYIFTGWDVAVNGSTTTCVAMYCDETSNYVCRVGNTYYTDIDTALGYASSGEVVLFANINCNYFCIRNVNTTLRLVKNVVITHTNNNMVPEAITNGFNTLTIDTNGFELSIINSYGYAIDSTQDLVIKGGGKISTTKNIRLSKTIIIKDNTTVIAPIELYNSNAYIVVESVNEQSKIDVIKTYSASTSLLKISEEVVIYSPQTISTNICKMVYLTEYSKYYKLSENYNENAKEYRYKTDISTELVKTTIKVDSSIFAKTEYSVGTSVSWGNLKELTGLEATKDNKYLTFRIVGTKGSTETTLGTLANWSSPGSTDDSVGFIAPRTYKIEESYEYTIYAEYKTEAELNKIFNIDIDDWDLEL